VRTVSRTAAAVGKVLLVAVTVVCLLSIGGAMLFAFPVLVPLHWLGARSSGGYGAGAWTFLAAASVFQGGWMLTYAATDSGALGFPIGIGAATVTAVVFLRAAAGHVQAGTVSTR
jgi:hypothetical protein